MTGEKDAGPLPAGSAPPPGPTAGPLLWATVCAGGPAAVAAVYERALGLKVLERGVVSAALAASWGAPALAGAVALQVGHAPGEPGQVRIVAADAAPALRHPGWRAIELCVTDVRAVRERVGAAGLRILGEPAPIPGTDGISAMQALGPAGEMLYLTEVADEGVFELPQARHLVDRVFIGVASVPDLDAGEAFYARHLGATVPAPAFTAPIDCVNTVTGLPATTQHTFLAAQLGGRSVIELDGHPAELLAERPGLAATLPGGTAMMTLEVPSLEATGLALPWPVVQEPSAPYGGARSAVVLGPGGERLELIERGA